jgi:hypothetical protein
LVERCEERCARRPEITQQYQCMMADSLSAIQRVA